MVLKWLDSLDVVQRIYIGLMQTNTRIFYLYRDTFFLFPLESCVIRILALITWETSAIGHHGRNWQKQWANIFIYYFIFRPFSFYFCFVIFADNCQRIKDYITGYEGVYGPSSWRWNLKLSRRWRYGFALDEVNHITMDFRFGLLLQCWIWNYVRLWIQH